MDREAVKMKRFDKAFKAQAVKMVTEEGQKASEVARSLGIHANRLYNWKKRYVSEDDKAFVAKDYLSQREFSPPVKVGGRLLDMQRRFHAYCVGTGRSGTNSMAAIFYSCYRTAHEPHTKELLTMIPALEKGFISKQNFRKYVIYLDNKLQLEFNSSFLNSLLLDVFVSEFRDAKFILTIRDCYSWLNSFINCLLFSYREIPSEWKKFLNILFGKGTYRYVKEERILYENGLYTLDSFLSHWAKINNKILTTVPKDRLLVIRTHEISSEINKIAGFLNISPKTLDVTKSHQNKSMKHPNILSKIDKDYLSSKVNLHCRFLMDKFFPDFIYTFA